MSASPGGEADLRQQPTSPHTGRTFSSIAPAHPGR